MHVVEDLDGTNLARALVGPRIIELTLQCPKYVADGVVHPAESFTIASREGIATLAAICEQMLVEYHQLNPGD